MGGTGVGSYNVIYPTVHQQRARHQIQDRHRLSEHHRDRDRDGARRGAGPRRQQLQQPERPSTATGCKTGKINLLAQVGLERDPEFRDRAADHRLRQDRRGSRRSCSFFSTDVVIGRPFVTSPGVPAERVAMLRKAFDRLLKDPAFLRRRQEGRHRHLAGRRREDPEDRRRFHEHARRHRRQGQGRDGAEGHSPSARQAMKKLHLTIATQDYDHFRDFRTGEVQRRRHRAHLADAGAARDLRALHRQPRMGRERTVVREIRRAGDAQEPRHPGAAGGRARGISGSRRSSSTRRARSKAPKDLKGKKVGSPEWAHTAAVYMRGWLGDECGVALKDVHWYQAGTQPGRPHREGRASICRRASSSPASRTSRSPTCWPKARSTARWWRGRPTASCSGHPDVVRLFPNYLEMEEQYYARTKVWPIMHVIAIKKSILDRDPWVAGSLYNAFDGIEGRAASRGSPTSRCRAIRCPGSSTYARRMRDMFDGDPFPLRHRGEPPDARAVHALHPRAGHRAPPRQGRRHFPEGHDGRAFDLGLDRTPRRRLLSTKNVALFSLPRLPAASAEEAPGHQTNFAI